MSKVVNFNAPKSIDGVIEKVKENKQNFIAPKARMQQSIENDAQYLVALGHFISNAQKEMEKMEVIQIVVSMALYHLYHKIIGLKLIFILFSIKKKGYLIFPLLVLEISILS